MSRNAQKQQLVSQVLFLHKPCGIHILRMVTDKQSNNMAELHLTFDVVHCVWNTERLYYTFKTDVFHINQVACPQIKYCRWGHNCYAGRGLLTVMPGILVVCVSSNIRNLVSTSVST